MRSLNMEKAIAELGADLRLARTRRRMSVNDMAERAGLDRKTVMRLEKGDERVSLGVLGRVLLVLGEERRLAALLDPGTDDTGLLLDQDRLPARVRSRRDPITQISESIPPEPGEENYGIGF